MKEMSSVLHGRKALLGGALLVWAFIECCINESYSQDRLIWSDPNYAIFMVIGDILLLLWMWGVSLQVWRSCGIDWSSLLGIDHSPLATAENPEEAVYEAAIEASIAYLTCFSVFNMCIRSVYFSTSSSAAPSTISSLASGGENVQNEAHVITNISQSHNVHSFQAAHVLPPLLLAFLIYRTVTPWTSRKIWLNYIAYCLYAPLCAVTFRCGYVGDILTSLARVIVKSAYAVCYLLFIPYALWSQAQPFEYLHNGEWWANPSVQQGLVPWLTLLPLWIRLMQCLRRMVETGHRWPHLANAFKYTSAMIVISIGAMVPSVRTDSGVFAWLWVMAFIGATCYQFVWDLTMDWGLIVPLTHADADSTVNLSAALSAQLGLGHVMDADLEETRPASELRRVTSRRQESGAVQRFLNWLLGGYALRKRRLLGPLWVYLCIILLNFILRFAWTLTILQANAHPNTSGQSYGFSLLMAYLTPVIAAAEVVRRMVWGFLRLEWEQVEKQAQAQIRTEAQSFSKGKALAVHDKKWESGKVEMHAKDEEEEEEEKVVVVVEEEGVGEEGGAFQPMLLSGGSGLGSAASWSHWFPGNAASNNSTLLYDAADPDGRFHTLQPVLHLMRTTLLLIVDSVASLLERAFALGKYVLGVDSASADNSGYGQGYGLQGYYRRLFDDAPWCVLPVPQSASEWFSKNFGFYFGVEVQDVGNAHARYSEVQMQDLFVEETGARGVECAGKDTSVVRRGKGKVSFERGSQLLGEAAAFAALMLTFLVLITFI